MRHTIHTLTLRNLLHINAGHIRIVADPETQKTVSEKFPASTGVGALCTKWTCSYNTVTNAAHVSLSLTSSRSVSIFVIYYIPRSFTHDRQRRGRQGRSTCRLN